MKMNLFKLTFSILFVLLGFFRASGQDSDTILLSTEFEQLNINKSISIITSGSARSTQDILIEYYAQIKHEKDKTKSAIGFSSDNYWVIFHVSNQSGKNQLIDIVVNNPHIDFLDLYELSDSLEIKKLYATGDRTTFDSRPVKNRLFIFPFSIKNNETKSFLLKIDKRNAAVSFPLSLWKQDARYNYDYKYNFIYGAYFGIIFLIFVYSIIGFFYLKNSTFFYYAFYVLVLGLYFFTVLGYSFQYIYPGSVDANNHARVVLIVLILAFLIRFSQKILLTKQFAPVLHKVFNGIIIFIGLMMVKWLFFTTLYTPFTITFLKVFYFIIFLSVIIIVISLAKVYKYQKKITLFYIAAFTSFFVGAVLVIFIEFGIINEEVFFINPMFIGSAIELIIFAFALSYRIKQVFENNTELSVKVAETQKQNLRSHLQGVEKERIRIAKQLHDSVGSKINILKGSLGKETLEDQDLSVQIDEIAKLVRDISHEIYLPELKMVGLKSKLENLKSSFKKSNEIGLEIDFYDFPDRLSSEIEKEIYHIIEEALNNVLKYAAASEVIIQLFGHETELNITIDDNGNGFDMTKKDHLNGIGLKIMKSRAESLNGSFEISSSPGRGTAIVVVIPFVA